MNRSFVILFILSGIAVFAFSLFSLITHSENSNESVSPSIKPPEFLYAIDYPKTVDVQIQFPVGLALDPAGNMYLLEWISASIHAFNRTGEYLGSFEHVGDLQEMSAMWNSASAIDSVGDMYVPVGNSIQVLDSRGNQKFSFGDEGSLDGQFQGPLWVAIDSKGYVYVSDHWNNRIQVFDSLGDHMLTFGEYGQLDGQFNHPTAIFVDKMDRIYVAESNNERLQVFGSIHHR